MRSIRQNLTMLDKLEDLVWAENITTEKYLKVMAIVREKEKQLRCALAAEIVELKKNAPRLIGV